MQQNANYIVRAETDAGTAEDGSRLSDYMIECNATGEVRLLLGCVLLDMDVFSEDDWNAILEEA